MSMETAKKYCDAMKERDTEAAVSVLTEDAVMETPMLGTKNGRKEIKGTLDMIVKMGGGNLSEPEDKNGQIFTIASSPMGKMLVTFDFNDEALISGLSIQRL